MAMHAARDGLSDPATREDCAKVEAEYGPLPINANDAVRDRRRRPIFMAKLKRLYGQGRLPLAPMRELGALHTRPRDA